MLRKNLDCDILLLDIKIERQNDKLTCVQRIKVWIARNRLNCIEEEYPYLLSTCFTSNNRRVHWFYGLLCLLRWAIWKLSPFLGCRVSCSLSLDLKSRNIVFTATGLTASDHQEQNLYLMKVCLIHLEWLFKFKFSR